MLSFEWLRPVHVTSEHLGHPGCSQQHAVCPMQVACTECKLQGRLYSTTCAAGYECAVRCTMHLCTVQFVMRCLAATIHVVAK